MDASVRMYSCSPKPLLRFFLDLCGAFLLLLILATAFGQWHADRFPSWSDLLVAVLVPLPVYALLAFLAWLLAAITSVTVHDRGVLARAGSASPSILSWSEMHGVVLGGVIVLPYAIVKLQESDHVCAIPLWLKDFSGFVADVRQHAGSEHPLVRFLELYARHSSR